MSRQNRREFFKAAAPLPDLGIEFAAGALPIILTKRSCPVIRDVIKEAGMEQQLFPLVRAIDYLTTGDAALLEKLSPEVRGVVDQVVAKLRSQAQ